MVMIGQVPVRFYWLVMVVEMSGKCNILTTLKTYRKFSHIFGNLSHIFKKLFQFLFKFI